LALDPRLGVTAAEAEVSQLVTGNSGNDTAIANDSRSDIIFDGINDTVFTGAGNDEVDTLFAVNSPFSRGNRINTGSGQDTLSVNNGDRANGGSGDDYFDASSAMNYRLSGGKGHDIFDLGADRVRRSGVKVMTSSMSGKGAITCCPGEPEPINSGC